MLSPEQVAEQLGVSKRMIHQLVRDKKLSCVQVSAKKRMFLEEHIEEFLGRNTRLAQPQFDNRANTCEHDSVLKPRKKGGDKTEESLRAIKKELDNVGKKTK